MGFARSIGSSSLARRAVCAGLGGAMETAGMALAAIPAGAGVSPASGFVGSHTTVSEIGSTIPSNGDVNPYGVAVVGQSQGTEVAGDVLVSNFSPSGVQLGEKTISAGGTGALFGLAVSGNRMAVYFVDDSENQLNILH